MKLRMAVIWSSVAAIIVWLISWGLVWAFAGLVPETIAPRLGQVGDMFGAGAALFSAVAVGAVAVVLAFDVSERRKDLQDRERQFERERLAVRPFVVPIVEERDLRIGNAHRAGAGLLNVPVTMRIQLQNHAADPALNVRVSGRMLVPDASVGRTDAALPVALDSSEALDLESTLTGSTAQAFFKSVLDNHVVVRVSVEYSSVSDTHWLSTVDYRIDAKDRGTRTLIQDLLDNEEPSGEEDPAQQVGGGTAYVLRGRAIPGTWAQQSLTTRNFD